MLKIEKIPELSLNISENLFSDIQKVSNSCNRRRNQLDQEEDF